MSPFKGMSGTGDARDKLTGVSYCTWSAILASFSPHSVKVCNIDSQSTLALWGCGGKLRSSIWITFIPQDLTAVHSLH